MKQTIQPCRITGMLRVRPMEELSAGFAELLEPFWVSFSGQAGQALNRRFWLRSVSSKTIM